MVLVLITLYTPHEDGVFNSKRLVVLPRPLENAIKLKYLLSQKSNVQGVPLTREEYSGSTFKIMTSK